MTTTFNAREFLYADQLAAFVQASNGAVTPLQVLTNSSGHLILFSNDDMDAFPEKELAEMFVDRGRGRGLEQLTKEQRASEDAQIIADDKAQKAAIAASAKAIAMAQRKQELQAAADVQIAAQLAKEGLA